METQLTNEQEIEKALEDVKLAMQGSLKAKKDLIEVGLQAKKFHNEQQSAMQRLMALQRD